MQSLAIRSLLKFFFTKICFPLIMCFSKKIIFVGNALVCVLHKNFLDSLCFMLKYLMITMELLICVGESRLNYTSPSLFYFFFFLGRDWGAGVYPFPVIAKILAKIIKMLILIHLKNRWGKILCTAVFMSLWLNYLPPYQEIILLLGFLLFGIKWAYAKDTGWKYYFCRV